MLSMFRNRFYLAVVSGHFVVDVLNSMGAVLLAVLAVPLGLSNAQIGLTITAYLLVGSLSQPLFGIVADRFASRTALLGAIGVFWMAVFFTAVAFTPTWALLLPFFMLAALGSGLFHPVGTAAAAAAMPERANSATAVFFFCGQMGLAAGPALAGILFGRAGSLGILPLAALALVPVALLLLSMRSHAAITLNHGVGGKKKSAGKRSNWTRVGFLLIAAFIVLVALRSSIQATFQAFLPKLFEDRGWSPEVYGLLTGVFMGTAAFGNVAIGNFADRFGMRSATLWPLLLSVPAGLACLLAPSTAVIFIAAGLAGFLVGGQHSVMVVHAQRLLPTGQGFAAGLILGFTFATGAIGTSIVGIAADSFGLQTVMQATVWLGLPAALLAATLPGRVVAPVTAPVETTEAAASTAD